MKKTPLVILSLLCAIPAVAGEAQQITEVPTDAGYLYSMRRSDREYRPSIRGEGKQRLIDSALKAIQQKESELDLELKCQTVFYKWTFDSVTTCRQPGTIGAEEKSCNPIYVLFNGYDPTTTRDVSVEAYCQVRSYDQKVLVSLRRRCEQSPTEECLDEKVKLAIQSIQPTVRYDIDKPSN